ncbi:uncharacterized protein [Triticum aestivum]|uniref:uncharacterized protein n=1 Tax=Triticum aestivum TaxID=4565 RepID=UPI001D01C903|nr:uncharacterized protein LOC123185457 [Triticum aestivum]
MVRSSFVGFSLVNGGGGISFGSGGSESMGFTFSSGAGGIRIRDGSSRAATIEGTGFGLAGQNGQEMTNGDTPTIGYRGVGYNPNFAHADEYPPSQEHVQIQKEPIDLNVMSNKETRTHYRTDDKRHIYSEILARNGGGNRLKHGVSKAVALACECPRRIVQRVWQQAKNGGGITGVKNNRKLKSGRKKINLNIDALEAIPPGERTTLEQVAGHLNLSTTTVWRRLRGAWEPKPADTVDREKSREYLVKYEAARGGWDIRMIYQPPNSPDTNILDLGWFASIQAMFHRKMPKTLAEIVQKVNQSLAEYPHQRLNRIWLSHQACMREIIKHKGSIHYVVPHLKKKALERKADIGTIFESLSLKVCVSKFVFELKH